MFELKCINCNKTEQSTIQIPHWICDKCLEEEQELEHLDMVNKIEEDDLRAYGDHLQDWFT